MTFLPTIFRNPTGAPVLPSVYYMDKGKLHIDFGAVKLPAYDEISEENIKDISARSIAMYEPFVRKYPEQWFSLFHRLWSKKDYPEVRRTLQQIFSKFHLSSCTEITLLYSSFLVY